MKNCNPTMVFISDIVEDNGKTIFENNMELMHNIPIDSLVEVKWDDWLGDGVCKKVHARLFVYKQGRDCDGTPLYWLSEYNKEGTDILIDHFGKFSVKLQGGFSEDSLTVIEITEDLKRGEGALRWDDKEV